MLKYAIVGHPNAGKTTLFNTLTNQNLDVGNWHGVTVNEQSSTFVHKGEKFIAVDLPGFYSLSCVDGEEEITRNFLYNEIYDQIIFVVEAKKLKRAEKLILELKRFNKNIIVFVNGYDKFKESGGKIDFEAFKQKLMVEVVFGNAFDKKCVDKIIQISQGKTKARFQTKDCEEYFFAPKRQKKFQDLFFSKYFALPFFVISMVFTFWFCFGKFSPISLISEAIGRLFDNFIVKILKAVTLGVFSPFLYGLIFDGIFVGVVSVLKFLPQICALTFCMNFLNQSGFFSRFSAVADDFLSKFGLNGRALYTLVSGFGCSAIAISSSNGIADEKIRKRVALSLPAVSCLAKTPVYTYLATGLFAENAFIIISAIYFLSIIVPLVNSFFLQKTFFKGEVDNYTCEVADMRIPAFKPLIKPLQKTANQFIIKVGTIILISSAFTWILKSISLEFKLLSSDQIESSLLCFVGKKVSFLLYPIGIKDWRYAVGIIVGIFAKEGIVSTLSLLLASSSALSTASKFAFLIFCYAYTPCVTALGVYKKEFGFKFMLICAVYWLIGGLLFSYLTYFILNL